MRAALALDDEGNLETKRRKLLVIFTQPSVITRWDRVLAFCGKRELPATLPLDELAPSQEVEILHAILAWIEGLDPRDAVAMQRWLKKKAMLEGDLRHANNAPPSSETPGGSPSISASPSVPPMPSAFGKA
jgi:hypothetical protein